ncbi:hypothetical protein ALI22I_29255 [Saccharothrix sp. ALI-22-I]|uniref:hypothetical protein n=1 Tax=Saccharothrix sp. ALI-22-I TaxID=1933778 RepID=UPI00097C5793|nr:hypothetical protein [Saccharothrix sp. ALI-22-I]ONI84632.1 hypothetical protein ALI22I_29255 [Saccharothrix sp. ALI-22-I]
MSSDELNAYAPPQDTGSPDAVETDPATLNSAEDLDEDRLRQDPLEAGMDPPEHWTGADKYGTTPYEQAHPRPLDERLGEEQPDVTATETRRDPIYEDQIGRDPGVVSLDDVTGQPADDARNLAEAERRGQAADEPGGPTAEALRLPDDQP